MEDLMTDETGEETELPCLIWQIRNEPAYADQNPISSGKDMGDQYPNISRYI